MFSDSIPPSDSTPSGSWSEGETYYEHKERMTKLSGHETAEQFQTAWKSGKIMDDPAGFCLMDQLMTAAGQEIQKETQKLKEAARKLKASLEGKDE